MITHWRQYGWIQGYYGTLEFSGVIQFCWLILIFWVNLNLKVWWSFIYHFWQMIWCLVFFNFLTDSKNDCFDGSLIIGLQDKLFGNVRRFSRRIGSMRRKSSVQTSRETEDVSNGQNRTGSKLARSASGKATRPKLLSNPTWTFPQLGARQAINNRYIIS